MTQVLLAGPLEISTQNLTINGAGVTLDGQLKGRVLHVAAGASATLQGLTITRGLLAGKGIDLHGSADSGSSWGAGMRNDGALVLDGVQVVGNYATGGGGGYSMSVNLPSAGVSCGVVAAAAAAHGQPWAAALCTAPVAMAGPALTQICPAPIPFP